MVEDWLVDDGLSYKTVNERYKILKSVPEYGLRNDYIDVSIIGNLNVEKINLSEKEKINTLRKMKLA